MGKPNLSPSGTASFLEGVAKGFQTIAKQKKEEEAQAMASKAKLYEMMFESQLRIGEKEAASGFNIQELMAGGVIQKDIQQERLAATSIENEMDRVWKDMQRQYGEVFEREERTGTQLFDMGKGAREYSYDRELESLRSTGRLNEAKVMESIKRQYDLDDREWNIASSIAEMRAKHTLDLDLLEKKSADALVLAGANSAAAMKQSKMIRDSIEGQGALNRTNDEALLMLKINLGGKEPTFGDSSAVSLWKMLLGRHQDILDWAALNPEKTEELGESLQRLTSVIEGFQPEIERIYKKHDVDISGLRTPKLTAEIDKSWLPFGWGDKTTYKPTLKGGKPETPAAETTAGDLSITPLQFQFNYAVAGMRELGMTYPTQEFILELLDRGYSQEVIDALKKKYPKPTTKFVAPPEPGSR